MASRQRGTAVEQVEGEGIYEKAHLLDKIEDVKLDEQGELSVDTSNNLIPRGITIQASGDDGFYIYQTILNGK